VLYNIGWKLSGPLLGISGLFSPKLARAVAGRREAVTRFQAWAGSHRAGPDLPPLLMLHGASAGELTGAFPVIRELRRSIADLQVVVTYSSPSGEEVADDIQPETHWFVPFDRPDHARAALEALRPNALVFAKLDVWPTLTDQAVQLGIPVGMINATVRPGSGRLRFPGRQLLRSAYSRLQAVGAVSLEEKQRLLRLGVPPAAILVTGDASFDQALRRVQSAEHLPSRLPERVVDFVRLIAGSTWPADEDFLLDAVAEEPHVELILVPHEPGPETVARLAAEVERRLGTPARLWSELAEENGEHHPSNPLIIDAVGLLAELYREADIAYVGGGLDGTGLHSVIEPAAAGLPVLFGSRHDRWEARELVAEGGAMELDPSSTTIPLLRDRERLSAMGYAARAYVLGKEGAARAGADLVVDLLGD
jgi:3-deoxy-D-manno-octulosonic-acid transferase